MSALSRLITRVTIRQCQIARTVDEFSTILDRTVAFAEAETPYIGEEEINEIIPYIPVQEAEATDEASTEATGETDTMTDVSEDA